MIPVTSVRLTIPSSAIIEPSFTTRVVMSKIPPCNNSVTAGKHCLFARESEMKTNSRSQPLFDSDY